MKRTIIGLVVTVILASALVIPYGLANAQTDSYQAPVNIATGLYVDRTDYPGIALGPQDSLVVGWRSGSGMGFVSKKSGGTWAAINGIKGGNVPEIAISASSTTYAVWEVSGEVFCSSRPAEGSWSEPLNISNSAESSVEPAIAVDSSNTIHVVWSEDGKILYRSSSDGISWSASVNLSQTSERCVFPGIATDASGDIHIVWQQFPWQIFYSMKPVGGAWSAPADISSTAVSRQFVEPDICVDGSGTVHVAVFARTSNINTPEVLYIEKQYGSWLQPVEIGNYSGSIYGIAKLAADNQGGVHVVWSAQTGATFEILYTHRPGGQPWQAPIKISSSVAPSHQPDVVTDSTGGVHIVWNEGGSRILYTSTPSSPVPPPDTGTITGTVASVPTPSGAFNEYNLYLQLTGTSERFWCAATTIDFPDLLTWGVTVTGTLNNSLGWWVFSAAAPTITPTPTSGTVTGKVASLPVPNGGPIKITGTGERFWCAATTTDFPDLLTVGSTVTGTLNNSLGWWVLKK